MPDMQKPLVDFLNHSILPFVGRAAELRHGFEFWRSTIQGERLRGALVLGEAGVGKSYYADRLAAEVTGAGGTVVRVRLYPESSTSLLSLLANALWDCEPVRKVAGSKGIDESPSATIEGLRRLARLRPTLLILEDLHLLEGSGLGEFFNLISAVDDEILAILALARPVELPARGVLAPYLAETIELAGLTGQEVTELWQALFGLPPDDGVRDLLQQTTGGNLLALRSALRGALHSGAIVSMQLPSGPQKVSVDMAQFVLATRNNVGLLSNGMAVHLSDEERQAAERLATLGEVFAAESARALLGDDAPMLDRLLFRGVVARSITPPVRLTSSAGAELPYAFTHTLLHRHLLERGAVDPGRLLAIVADGLPVYSLVPLTLLREHAGELDADSEQLGRAIRQLLEMAVDLHRSTNHERSAEVWQTAEALRGVIPADAPAEQLLDLDLAILSTQIVIRLSQINTDEFGLLVDRFLEATGAALPEPLHHYRLLALRVKHARWYRQNYPAFDDSVRQTFLAEIEGLLEASPSLRFHPDFPFYLASVAQAASTDSIMVRWVDGQLQAFLASDEVPEELRARGLQRVAPFLINLYSSDEELAARCELLAQLDAAGEGNDIHLLYRRLWLMVETTPYNAELLESLERGVQQFKDHGLMPQALSMAILRLRILAGLGQDLDRIHEAAIRIVASAPAAIMKTFIRFAGPHLVWIGLLRHQGRWGKSVFDEIGGEEISLSIEHHLLIAGEEGSLKEGAARFAGHPEEAGPLHKLVQLVAGSGDVTADNAIAEAREVLGGSLLHLPDTLVPRAAIELLEVAEEGTPDILKALGPDIGQALGRTLTLMARNEATAFMAPLLERYGNYLPAKELKQWRTTLAEITRRQKEAAQTSENRLALSMFGQIEAQTSEGETIPIRGGRLRTVLGLLVADRMLRKPLGHREFCYIAAGSDDELDPENARKTMNNAIFRLRELLGESTILTDAPTPRLNDAAVTVDLLEADRLLRQAASDARAGALMRAVPALRRAVELSHGEVPFPSLYEEMFEALREDFENRLRDGILDLAGRLLRAGDAAGAEELLRPALEAIPEDEELAELLQEALVQLNRRGDARRVGMAAEAGDR
jgi:hypothetical protein